MDKVRATPEDAVSDISDGATIAIAGFGVSHRFPSSLIVALRDNGPRNLRIVCNSLGSPGELRANILADAGQISRIVAAFTARPGVESELGKQIEAGLVTYELVPQGVLVERLRAAGAGIAAFYSPVAVGTVVSEGKEVRDFNGRDYVLEQSLPVDYAFIRAAVADKAGNLKFHGSSQNFNPSFAKAARVAIAEVDEIVETGEIPPNEVDLPGIFVHRVVKSTIDLSVADIVRHPRRSADSGKEYNGKPALRRTDMAQRAAQLITDGSYLNLGMGLPTLVGDYLRDRDIAMHAENGVLGYGELVSGTDVDPDVYNASGAFVAIRPGASFFDSVESFEMIRGGKIDFVILGAYQVDQERNLANWTTPEMIGGGIGGAMDLVAGGAKLIILMEHCDSKGRPKLVDHCTYPLTGMNCVDVIVTDLAVLVRSGDGFVLEEVAPGFSTEEIVELSTMKFAIAPNVKEITINAAVTS